MTAYPDISERWSPGAHDEPTLVLLPAAVLVGGVAAVMLALGTRPTTPLIVLMTAVVGTICVTPLLVRLRHYAWDPVLAGAAWMLSGLSAIVVARVAPELLTRQLLWIVVAWVVCMATLEVPDVLERLRRYKYTWLTVGIALVIAALLFGVDPNGSGARLWLRIGPITAQPSEILRVLLVVFMAGYLDARGGLLTAAATRIGPLRLPPPPYLLPLLAMVGLSAALLFAQNDLGPTLLYAATFVVMMYLVTGQAGYLLGGLAMLVTAGFLGYATSAKVHDRFDIWLDPWTVPETGGYQTLQALGGFAFGGLLGAGPGWGYPTLVPAAHTDYSLAVLGEEWGLVVVLAALALYAVITVRALANAARAVSEPFARLLGAGLAASFGLQVLIVLSGVLRLMPVAGIASPFLSYGGSSMVTNWFVLGLLMRVRAAGTLRSRDD